MATRLVRGRRRVSALAAMAVVTAATLTVPAAGTVSAGPVQRQAPSARMRPSLATAPIRAAGNRASSGGRLFHCQVTSPPTCYGPAQIRAAYGVDKLAQRGLTGRGRTIVIIDAYSSPTIAADLERFDHLFGLPAANFRQVAPDGVPPFDINDGAQVFWAGEISLDVEWAHAIAPAAKIVLVKARSDLDRDIESALEYAVEHNLGDVVSPSYSEDERCPDIHIRHFHRLLATAASKRMTVLAVTGDQGPAQVNCAGTGYVRAAGYPASDPLVTAVGGTELAADGRSGRYERETAWSEPYLAGGSGTSAKFSAPPYQSGRHFTGRTIPDISYNAGGISGAVLVVFSSQNYGLGSVLAFVGTSAGSPQWAGLIALVDQARHGRAGFVNDDLYRLAARPAIYRAAFHDIIAGNNTFRAGSDGTFVGFDAHRGYDRATGLGSPRADVLVPLLAGRH